MKHNNNKARQAVLQRELALELGLHVAYFRGVLHSGQVQLSGCNVRIQVIIIDSHLPSLCV